LRPPWTCARGLSPKAEKGGTLRRRPRSTTLGRGIRIIDTPGIREFGIGFAAAADMPEFDAYARRCRFRDCTHTHEPGCAVKDAVASGEIPRRRYEGYLRMLNLP
jgi:ribosome biogenesis GTPase